MEVTILDNLKMIKLREKEDCIIQMEIIIQESGRMIKLMDLANIILLVEANTKVVGKMIRGMDSANSFGLMGQGLRGTTNLMKRVGRVSFSIQMAIPMSANLKIVRGKEKVC